MEHLRGVRSLWGEGSLNPCFNGIQMEHYYQCIFGSLFVSLNPCFNGIQMERSLKMRGMPSISVLILVLMEYKWNSTCTSAVPDWMTGLNPCFNGIQMEPIGANAQTIVTTS